MSDGSAKIVTDWADGEHSFRLAYKQIRELQGKTGVGPEALYRRVRSGDWMVEDLREVIRLGLIGGGMDEVDAVKLVRIHCDDNEKGWARHKPIAIAILLAALMGPPEDTPDMGKTEARPPSDSPSPSLSETLA